MRILQLVPVIALFSLAQAFAVEMEEVRVQAKSLRLHDEVSYGPAKIAIEQPASDIYLGETLSKLPGVLVRSTSGFGSATTVITSQALGSAGTSVTIDDIPVVESSGRGVNFSLFPSALIGSVEQNSPFYSTFDPTAATLPTPGGRINLRTLAALKQGELPWVGSLVMGSGKSIQGTAAYRGRARAKDHWIIGVNGYNTAGDFPFKNPLNQRNESRNNNDAVGAGLLAKYKFHFDGGSTVEALNFFSNSDRTNPGSLTQPTRQHQKDTFNLLGFKYDGPDALGKRNGLFGKAAIGYSRTGTRGQDAFNQTTRAGAGVSTDSRSWGGYTQAGFIRRDERSSVTLAFDDQFDYMRKDEGVFNRNVFGTTATFSLDVGKFRFMPLGRMDASSRFRSAGDGAMSVMYMPDGDNDLALSYGVQHTYPSITAVTGFVNSGLVVLPNPALDVQRDNMVSLTFNRRKSRYTLYSTAFYDLVRNRSTFVFRRNTAQFVNVASVSVLGYTIDGQLFPIEPLALRGSLTLTRAWNRSTGDEMPYKPRLEGWASVSYLVWKNLGVTIQEQFVTKRFVAERGVDAVSPFIQTIVRLDARLWEGSLFFKVANLFNVDGFENPGFPFPGRTYWLGYSFGAGS